MTNFIGAAQNNCRAHKTRGLFTQRRKCPLSKEPVSEPGKRELAEGRLFGKSFRASFNP